MTLLGPTASAGFIAYGWGRDSFAPRELSDRRFGVLTSLGRHLSWFGQVLSVERCTLQREIWWQAHARVVSRINCLQGLGIMVIESNVMKACPGSKTRSPSQTCQMLSTRRYFKPKPTDVGLVVFFLGLIAMVSALPADYAGTFKDDRLTVTLTNSQCNIVSVPSIPPEIGVVGLEAGGFIADDQADCSRNSPAIRTNSPNTITARATCIAIAYQTRSGFPVAVNDAYSFV